MRRVKFASIVGIAGSLSLVILIGANLSEAILISSQEKFNPPVFSENSSIQEIIDSNNFFLQSNQTLPDVQGWLNELEPSNPIQTQIQAAINLASFLNTNPFSELNPNIVSAFLRHLPRIFDYSESTPQKKDEVLNNIEQALLQMLEGKAEADKKSFPVWTIFNLAGLLSVLPEGIETLTQHLAQDISEKAEILSDEKAQEVTLNVLGIIIPSLNDDLKRVLSLKIVEKIYNGSRETSKVAAEILGKISSFLPEDLKVEIAWGLGSKVWENPIRIIPALGGIVPSLNNEVQESLELKRNLALKIEEEFLQIIPGIVVQVLGKIVSSLPNDEALSLNVKEELALKIGDTLSIAPKEVAIALGKIVPSLPQSSSLRKDLTLKLVENLDYARNPDKAVRTEIASSLENIIPSLNDDNFLYELASIVTSISEREPSPANPRGEVFVVLPAQILGDVLGKIVGSITENRLKMSLLDDFLELLNETRSQNLEMILMYPLNILSRDKILNITAKIKMKEVLLNALDHSSLLITQVLAANSLYFIYRDVESGEVRQEIENRVIAKFNLGEISQGIWQKYGILVTIDTVTGLPEREFFEPELRKIQEMLGNIPESLSIGLITAIFSMDVDLKGVTSHRTGMIYLLGDFLNKSGSIINNINDFVVILYHEIGHAIHGRMVSMPGWQEFKELHQRSLGDEFSREYGNTNEYEDFATLLEIIATKTEEIVHKARILANAGRNNLLNKLKVIVDLFKFREVGPDGVERWYMYVYDVDEQGNFNYEDRDKKILPKKEIGPDGLPIF